jgi:hypothetical protein
MSEKTPEQLAAEAAAAEAQKKADKEAADKVKAEKKAAADAIKAQKKADADAAKAKKAEEAAAKKAAAEKEKADKKAAAEKAKADKEAAKAASKVQMPEQNGVRRPKPDGACGKAWAEMDRLSSVLGQPVPIATLLESTNKAGLNEGNVRAEYARWRKFNGVTGRVTLPTPPAAAAGAPAA